MTDTPQEVDPWASKSEPWVILASGTQGYPFRPDPNEIHIEDIAQSLSKQCRYNGHIHPRYKNDIYSVAQHCVLAVDLFQTQPCAVNLFESAAPTISVTRLRLISLGILLHDAGEHVFGDMLSPVKSRYPQFKQDEKAYSAVVFEKYGVPSIDADPALYKVIHWADWQMVLMEMRELTAITPELWKQWVGDERPTQSLCDVDPFFRLWGPAESYDRFMATFEELREI